MEQEKYLPELMAEKDSLDPSFVHATRLLAEEIEKFQGSDGKKEDEEKKYLDVISNKNIKLSERVLIPVKQYPKFNFVGKLLGPRGNSLKRLQEETGAKMSILGKGSMRDKAKEEELRKSGEAKYAHLSDELHVLIEVFAPPGEAYSRMSHALEEIKKFLVPDYNDEIRQEQLRELSYLNGSEDSSRGRGIRGRGIRVPPTAPSRGRGGAIPPPPPPGRGVPAPRGTTVTRGALPVPPVARGVPTPRARGAPAVPGYRPPPPPAHEAYEEYGYDDGYGGEYDDQSYEAYDSSYATQTQSVPEYYDYGHGTSEDAYDSYAQEEWAPTRSSLKAPPPRAARGGYREHPYGITAHDYPLYFLCISSYTVGVTLTLVLFYNTDLKDFGKHRL
ncbi:KH domain-containing, RNA-binding, signal transduction-associated protein 2 [Trichosurus vulpecula]|uniref:KH domain-containing, RNA-binding, signal transduction-associated protein 2 n=1 Tax=Phascolarctos cinereus TaxID=38626 RepID=A0A6P5LK51_PHACI|nr:KH domain-containing, RNA-binding, signal transduction-associated protein 2 isoform X1 [Phascolarctos cinereus]XP_036623455.1 KH domain-containing, RNA-binding, signal transduction-associated protein 2 [Trichosurus vulpecula]